MARIGFYLILTFIIVACFHHIASEDDPNDDKQETHDDPTVDDENEDSIKAKPNINKPIAKKGNSQNPNTPGQQITSGEKNGKGSRKINASVKTGQSLKQTSGGENNVKSSKQTKSGGKNGKESQQINTSGKNGKNQQQINPGKNNGVESLEDCMVACLGPDLCCSCKASYKEAMSVVVVDDLANNCARTNTNLRTCAQQWVVKTFSGPRSDASPCLDLNTTRVKVSSCADLCSGRPLAVSLNPNKMSANTGNLTKSSTLTHSCSDIRAEGILCNTYRNDSFTAGNSLCRSGTRCGFRGYTYKWCYTDFDNNWDYCCTDKCGFHKTNYMWCQSGTKWQYCGDPGNVSVRQRTCLTEFPCGMHQEKGRASYYWCYVDTNKNWDYCCQPQDTCSKKGSLYYWCYAGYKKYTQPKYCLNIKK